METQQECEILARLQMSTSCAADSLRISVYLNIRLQVAGASHETASQARDISHDATLQVAGASHEAASQARDVSHDTTLQVAGASLEAASQA